MNVETCAALLAINRRFYEQFAADFARTRRSRPAGFERILPHLRPAANVADLGCGNGRLLGFLAERGWRGRYLGVDSSAELLAIAAANAPRDPAIRSDFRRGELVTLDPATPLPLAGELGREEWDAVAVLAVLHHIPGRMHRLRLVAACAGLLRPGGVLVVSTWQFLAAARLRARILPWEAAGIQPEAVEPGDYLLAWGAGAAGQRYCAAIDEHALEELAATAGLTPEITFRADGHEGTLNLYGIFRKPPNP
ncbi:MAG: class I SAM-dependent methyltransferase [Anaerolineae bacterium]